MPIRVMPDGSFVCDTPDEAISMRDRLMERRAKEARREARRVARAGAPSDHVGAGNGDGDKTTALQALLVDSPDGISSDDLAQHLGVGARSLPPLMVALRRRAREKGHDLAQLLVRERIFDQSGRAVSRYRLTEEGVKLLKED
ncbi:MAG TPA: hypothetical protein VGX21_24490 [Methylomirabilota bacterium]|nr:hypothetical protein [Methylomirabilota bacterium]